MSASESTFYVTGGTLRHDAPSYVERQADKDLLDGLLKGEFCYVLTSRQMGKSSLMVRTAGKLREQDVRVVVLDLTAVGQPEAKEQWYFGLLTRLGVQTRLEDELEDFWLDHSSLGPAQRFFTAIHNVLLGPGVPALAGEAQANPSCSSGGEAPPAQAGTPNAPLVIFVDELDVVRSLPFSTDEFFAAIRECHTRRVEEPALERLTFCLLGVATPGDLIRDTRLTPFNIGRRIELHDFTRAEAAPLARGLSADGAHSTPLLERVLYWTDGHPYLTQRLCQAIAADADRGRPESVNRMCEALFFAARAREQDDNLLFVRERMLRSEVDLASLLHLYEQVRAHKQVRDDETNPLVSILRLSGITRARQGQLQVRNRIYERVFDRDWIRANMPDAEVRRQREAYRRGLMRAASVALLVLAVFAALAVYGMRQKRLTEAHLYVADMEVAQQAWDAGSFARAKELVEAHRHQRADLRGFEWRYLWKLCRGDDAFILGEHKDAAYFLTVSPDGRTVATRSGDGVLKVWDIASRQCRLTLQDLRGTQPIFSPDGKSLLFGGQPDVALVDLSNGQITSLLPGAGHLVRLLDDGRTVVTTDTNFIVRFWNLTTRQEQLRLPGVGGRLLRNTARLRVCVTQDGQRVAVIEQIQGYQDQGITVWDLGSQRPVAKLPDQRRLTVMQLSPDNRRLAVGSQEGTLKVWDLDSTNEPPLIRAHSSWVQDLAFSPDGRVLATCASDQTIKLWAISDDVAPRHLDTLRGHEAPIHAVSFTPDGTRLVSGGRDKTIRVWQLGRTQGIDLAPGVFDDAKDGRLFFLPDSKTLVGDSASGVKIWDAERMQLSAVLPGQDLVWQVSPDGKWIHTSVTNAADGNNFRLWDIQTRSVIREWPRTGMFPLASKIVSSPDGQIIVLGNNQGGIQFWDASRWRERALRTNHAQTVRSLVFSRDGSTMFSSSNDGTVRIWDMKTLQPVAALTVTTRPVVSQALSPDERTLAVGSEDTRIYLWDWRHRQLLATLKGHRQTVLSVDFSPDGKTLASGSSDGTVKLWNVALRREIATLRLELNGEPLQERVVYVGFSPDGNRLAARTYQGTLKVWRAASWEQIQVTEKTAKQ